MREQLEQRLTQLKAEFEEGQKMLADLEARQTNLRSTLLRISGAVQVLEELLTEGQPGDQNQPIPQETQPATGHGDRPNT
jgi:predicted nuclease with TOPRIM domain